MIGMRALLAKLPADLAAFREGESLSLRPLEERDVGSNPSPGILVSP
jgi:hypothetical protein